MSSVIVTTAALCLLVAWRASADPPTMSPTTSPIAVATLAPFSRNDTFEIIGPHIVVNGRPTVFTGVNTMHIYGGNSDNYPQLGISMVREFVGAVAHVPMYGSWASLIDGEYLHPLGKVLDNNEKNGLVTILDLHRWNKSDHTEFWAKIPSETPWYDAFLERVTTDFAELLRGRANVFLSIWNEPFHWDNLDGHMDADSDLWFDEMNALVTAIRNANITNVLVVPVGRMGQAEEILFTNSNAQRLLARHNNILFDVHAYTRWLKPSGHTPSPETDMRARLSALYDADIAVVVGEIGPSVAGSLRDPQPFLNVARKLGASVLAWQWCGDDGNALMSASSDCTAHNTAVENLGWASTFFQFAASQSFTSHRLNQLAHRERKVFLHYLPWYSDVGASGVRHGWCAAGDVTCATNLNNQQYVGPGPLIGEYDQYDDHVLEYHLLLAFVANADGLIININPEAPSQIEILVGVVDKIIELQQQYSWFDLKLILSYDDPTALDASTIGQQLEILRDSFYHNNSVSAAFFTDDFSKRFPVMFWSDQAADLYDIAASSVFEASPKILTINRNARNFDDSHGNMAWIGTMSTPQTANTNWGKDYLVDFEWRMKNQFQLNDMTGVGRQLAARFQVGCVWPGFDDSKVPVSWNGGTARYIADSVADGSTLELCFDFAKNATSPDNNLDTVPVDMPWLQVATFNDWPEGTAVEPTANVSDPYRRLRTVQHHTTGFTSNTPRHNDSEAEAALTFPLAVLQLRQSSSTFVSTMAIANAIDTFAGGHATEALAMLASQPAGHLGFPETIRASTAQTKLELLRTEAYADGLVVLEDAVGVGSSAGVAAVLTKQCYSASKIEAIVSYETQNITSDAYQGKLSLLATTTSTLDPSTGVTSFDAKFTRTIHAAIDHTYLGLENATGATLSDGHTGRQDEGRMKYILLQGQTVEADVFSAGSGWRSLEDYQKGTTLGVGVGCFHVGVQLSPNYNNVISIPLNYLRLLIDNDDDNMYDHIEALLGSSPDAVDTDNDGVNDSDDPKPIDRDTSVRLPLPLACTDASITRVQAGNGGVVLFVRNGQSGTCTLSFTHDNIGWNAKHTGAYAVDLHHDHPTRIDFTNDTLVLPVRANEDHYFQLVDGDFPPIVDTDVTQVIFEANTTASLSLLSLAFDFEDDAIDLVWSVESVHNASELRIAIDVINNTITFTEEVPECRTHDVKLRVMDSASNYANVEFALYILQPGEDAVPLLNAGFEDVGANRYSLEGWKGYTWGGTYDAAVSAGNMSLTHGLSMAIEGLSKGRYGIYQTISMSKGTYKLTFMLAHREVVAGDYGNVIDILFISHPTEGVDELLIQPIDVLGDSDWVTVTFEFTIDFPEPRETTFYLRFFGTGYVFFDDVVMTKLLCHQPLASNVLVISSVQSALVFVFPFKPEVDGVLCGYCEVGDSSEVCGRCADANYTFVASTNISEPFTIASFEVNTDIPFQAGGWAYDTTTFASRSVLIPDTYISAYDNTGLISDWSKWDMLKVDVYNPNANAEQFYVEIQDTQSNGYWSRVNWYTAVSPGYSTITVPLQIFVGEKTVTVERRRLDLTAITRLVFASTLCHCNLVIDNVRLEAEPIYNNLFSKLLRFDLGLESSPVEIGFAPVTPGDWYRARLGYGIDTESTIGRSEDRRHPTDLLRDWISFNSGGLNVDLPNGDYVVALVMEDPGYWEYFPSFSQRKVKAEGITVLDEAMNYSQFLSKYFHHQDTEDLPGDNIFSKYIRHRYTPLIFETSVADSQLNVHFETANTYACTVSTIIIFPKEEEQLGLGFLDELWDRMKLHFDAEYASAEYPATSGASLDENNPFPLFSRSPEQEVRGFDKTTLTDLNLWEKGWEIHPLALGETASISFSLHPPTPRVITSLAFAGEDFGAKNVTVFSVRHKIKRLSESVYTAIPLLMDPLALPFSLSGGVTRQFLLQFHFETAGCVNGSVVVGFDDGANMSIPIAVSVSQFNLEPIPQDIQIGYLGTSPIVTGTTFAEFDGVEHAGFEAATLTLKDLGMTGISGGLGGPNVKGYDNTGNINIDFTAADVTMTVLDEHWHKDVPVNSYFGLSLAGVSTSSSTWNPASTADVFGVDYDQVIADVLTAVDAHALTNNWRSLYHNLGDEPSDETSLRVLQVAQTFKQANPSTLTSVFTSIESNTSVKLGFADNVDLVILNHHSEEAIRALKTRNANVSFMLYNQASRYRAGAYLYRLATLGGLGHYQFALSSPGADPYYALDAREDDLCLLFLRADGSMTKTLETEVARAAVIDLRYVLTLNKLIVGGMLNGYDAVAFAAAQEYLSTLTDMMVVGTQAPQMSHAQLDEMRTNISNLVTAVMYSDDVGTTCDVGVVGALYNEPPSQAQACGDGDGGELVLVFRQTASPSLLTTSNWSRHNGNDITSDLFSVLDTLEDYRLPNNSFIFKLTWSFLNTTATQIEAGVGAGVDFGAKSPSVLWTQSSNPHTSDVDVIDAFTLITDTTNTSGGTVFGGLAASSSAFAHLDGNPNQPWWYYAIGVSRPYANGLPAFGRAPASVVELYVCSML
eukprot:m.224315 g.224315  ORF g.224315 m.224315 type:complete len:2544 (-) comp33425_c1_seq2:150-7781(-)